MKKLISALLLCWFATMAVGRAQTLDKEMAGLADRIGKAMAAKGCKNVAALDFTDLQGQPTELGRFLSEQLTVEIVATATVSMVDRANIRSILAEHKLTEEGLVNPANAKKLGEFAGVDAILMGNVTVLDDGIVLMVKAISTSSAQIVAAGRINFPKTSEIQQLSNRSVSGSAGVTSPASTLVRDQSATSYQESNAIATKDIGSLRVVLESVMPLRLKNRSGQSVNGIMCSFEFINRETHRSIIVAMNAEGATGAYPWHMGDYVRAALVDERGSLWRLSTSDVTGIGVVGAGGNPNFCNTVYNPTEIGALLQQRDASNSTVVSSKPCGGSYNYQFLFGSTNEIPPGQSLAVSMNWFPKMVGSESDPFPKFFQINSEIVVAIDTPETKRSYSLQNLTFDRVSMPK